MAHVFGRVADTRKHKRKVFADIYNGKNFTQIVLPRDLFSKKRFKRGDILYVFGKFEEGTWNKMRVLQVEKYNVAVRSTRYLGEDLDTKKLAIHRAHLDEIVRKILKKKGLVEVTSEILSDFAGCSKITPFKTEDFYGKSKFLRFTIDFNLRKYSCRTLLPVFEIGKVFRNMVTNRRHPVPEYKVVELYLPFRLIKDGISLVENIFLRSCAQFGLQIDGIPTHTVKELCSMIENDAGLAEKELYLKQVKCLPGPFFATNPPKDWSPLSTEDKDGTADDAELVFGGVGIAHIYSPIYNYQKLKDVFASQKESLLEVREDVDIDKELLKELRRGMPPSVAICIGLDRLLMALLGKKNMKEVIPFKS